MKKESILPVFQMLQASSLVVTIIASLCQSSSAQPESQSKPQLIIPMVTIERKFFVHPMEVKPNTELERLLDKAGLAKAEGRFEDARILYSHALKEAENSKDKSKIQMLLSCQMAECLFLSGRTKSAEAQYAQSLELYRVLRDKGASENFAPHMGLGYLYLRDGRYDDAAEKFNLVFSQTLDKTTVEGLKAREALGIAYAKQGKLSAARECFEKSVKDIEEDIEDDEDINASENADETEDYRATNFANLAYCEYLDGEIEAADKHYTRAETFTGSKPPSECKNAIAVLKSHIALLENVGREADAKKLEVRVKELEDRPITFVRAVVPPAKKGPDFGEYMSKLQKKIKAKWDLPKETLPNRLIVKFKINRDGSIKKLSVLRTSGTKEADEGGIKAVEEAAPFAALPQDFKGKAVTIQFTFDYNILNSNAARRYF